jgi:hypothetical protein
VNYFESNWQIGVTRRREGNPSSAIKAFTEAALIASDDIITHLERGHFLLDFGVAVFEHAVELRDVKLAEQAHLIFLSCDKYTKDSEDWRTNAQANLMLSKLYTNGARLAEAWERIRLARLAVCKTGDTYLSERIKQMQRLLEDIQKR